MLGKLIRTRTAVAIATAIATASVVGGIAYAASSPIDGGGVIHGCYNPTNGAMKLKTGAACPTRGMTTPISWGSQGVQGIQGVQGPKGDDGTRGAPGQNGASGTATGMFRGEKTADQAWSSGPFIATGPYPAVFVPVTFESESFDTTGAYDPLTSTYTVQADGYYQFDAQVVVGTQQNRGEFELVLAVNGQMSGRLDRQVVTGSEWETLNGASMLHLSSGDEVKIWIWSSDPTGLFLRNGDRNVPGLDYRNSSFFGYRIA